MANTTHDALVCEITDYLAGVLLPGIDPEGYARQIIASTEIVDGELNFEVPGRDTITGNPVPASFDAEAYAAEIEADIAAHAE